MADEAEGVARLADAHVPDREQRLRHRTSRTHLASTLPAGRHRTCAGRVQHHPKHYCGVFGIYGHPNAAELAYFGLYALQHRGQESAGIVTCHEGKFYKHHGMGLVPQIFNDPKVLHDLVGNMAVGHTRYSTTGSSQLKNAQPLTMDCARGQIAVAHNGNLTNAAQLRDELKTIARAVGELATSPRAEDDRRRSRD